MVPLVYKKDKSAGALQAMELARDQAKKLGIRGGRALENLSDLAGGFTEANKPGIGGGRALGEVAAAQARMGQMEEAMKTLAEIPQIGEQRSAINPYRMNGLRRIVRARADTGDWQGALETYALMPSTISNFDMLALIGAAQVRKGSRE